VTLFCEKLVSNHSSKSFGVNGDGEKLAGTRVDLDVICGKTNERCRQNSDGSLFRNEKGMVVFIGDEKNKTLSAFLQSDEGKKAIGATGGLQGGEGTLFGILYPPGGWVDKLVEAFAGSHDMIGGKLSGLYDNEGNATRGRSELVSSAQDTWSVVAIAPATPFAMSVFLPPEVWQAISIFLNSSR